MMTESTVTPAVNLRGLFHVPNTYAGMPQNLTYTANTLQQLVEAPPGVIDSQLRSGLQPKTSNSEYRTCALATLLEYDTDPSTVSVTASLNLSKDCMLNSWSQLEFYSLDFDLGLGRPRFTPVESLGCHMPKVLAGDIAVLICLRDEDMERLKNDEEFVRYGKQPG